MSGLKDRLGVGDCASIPVRGTRVSLCVPSSRPPPTPIPHSPGTTLLKYSEPSGWTGHLGEDDLENWWDARPGVWDHSQSLPPTLSHPTHTLAPKWAVWKQAKWRPWEVQKYCFSYLQKHDCLLTPVIMKIHIPLWEQVIKPWNAGHGQGKVRLGGTRKVPGAWDSGYHCLREQFLLETGAARDEGPRWAGDRKEPLKPKWVMIVIWVC